MLLIISAVIIFAITFLVTTSNGANWPSVFFGDILELNWLSQFNVDFLIHLFLLATWITWREGFTAKGYFFGFLSIFLGGMFGFLYILYASVQAKGDPKALLLGEHRDARI